MQIDRERALSLTVIGTLLLLACVATAEDIPLRDWPAPAMSAGRTAFADIGNPGVFQPMAPCRLADTRGLPPAVIFGPALAAGAPRNWSVTGNCEVPPLATAVSANFTATNTLGPGFLKVYPAGSPPPGVSTLNYGAGQTVANAAIVPLSAAGTITVVAGVSGTDLIMDINGYYTNLPNPGRQLFISGLFDAAAAIVGFNYSNTSGTHGVGGYAGGTGVVHGVQGEIGTAAAAGSSGVHGIGAATIQRTFGVLGESWSHTNDAAGVLGRSMAGTPPVIDNLASESGVRGEGGLRGVIGVGGPSGVGVRGFSVDAGGVLQQYGSLGSGNSWGVYANGNMGASGTKPFVEPHPYKAGTVIRYVALEGPEAGTYFRGRGRFVGGSAQIEVPESFRLVTDPEGITVQVTPIGRATAVGVLRIGLDVIEVEANRDVEFSFLVQGIRKTFKDWQVEVESDEYMPESPSEKIPNYLSDRQKRNLIESGVYNEDGTVNRNTARRLGWDRIWEARTQGAAR